jgi:glycerophosphoryl diester phosphodiesterase
MAADWLTARPVAHRGLHDAARGIIENTPSAVVAAVAAGYGIEVDLQISADGEAMVHHDDVLGRLIEGSGRLDQLPSAVLRGLPFKHISDRMMTLGELCDLVAGRATLLLELKSRFDDDERLARRVAKVVSGYSGPLAAMSFDPARLRMLQSFAPALRRGLVAQGRSTAPARHDGADARVGLTWFLSTPPQFLAYAVKDLPATLPLLAKLFGLPVLTWTVRNEEDRRRAARWADQIIFEEFTP